MLAIDIAPRVAVSNAISNHLGVLNVASVDYNLTLPTKRVPEVKQDFADAIVHVSKLQASRDFFEKDIVPAVNRIAIDGIPFYHSTELLLQKVKAPHKLSDDIIDETRSEFQVLDVSFDALAATVKNLVDKLEKIHDTVSIPLNLPFQDIKHKVENGHELYFDLCCKAFNRINGECKQSAGPLGFYLEDLRNIHRYLSYIRTSIIALFDLLFMSDASAIIGEACIDIIELMKFTSYALQGRKLKELYKGDPLLHHYHSKLSERIDARDFRVLQNGIQYPVLPILTEVFIPFSEVYSSPPRIAVGLTKIDIDSKNQIRNRVSADYYNLPPGVASTDAFRLTFEAPNPPDRVWTIGASWLEIPPNDVEIQHGREEVESREGHRYEAVIKEVTFARPYAAAPRVVAWLAKVDTVQSANHRFAVDVEDVTSKGFKIRFYTWSDSVWYQAHAEWFAFPADRPNVAAFHRLTTLSRLSEGHESNELVFEFAEAGKRFDREPHVFAALRLIDIDVNYVPRLEVIRGPVSKDRAVITVKTWDKSVVHSAGITCIAIASQ